MRTHQGQRESQQHLHEEARGSFNGSLYLLSLLTPFIALFVGGTPWLWFLALPLIGALAGLFWRKSSLFAYALPWPALYLTLALELPWPFLFLLPLLLFWLLGRLFPRLSTSHSWLVRGRLNPKSLGWSIPTILLSSGALLTWLSLTHPDLSDLVAILPRTHFALLILLGIAFAVLNSTIEELVFRGIMWSGLEAAFKRPWLTLLLQALLFGVVHINGFPRGLLGVLMASSYGFFIGLIRYYSKGLWIPIVAHFFADATIFTLLVLVALELI